MWEWVSTMPGMTNFPSARITSAPGGASTVGPISRIFPSTIRIDPFGISPWVTVSSVPP